jgi:hypothetical protein
MHERINDILLYADSIPHFSTKIILAKSHQSDLPVSVSRVDNL